VISTTEIQFHMYTTDVIKYRDHNPPPGVGKVVCKMRHRVKNTLLHEFEVVQHPYFKLSALSAQQCWVNRDWLAGYLRHACVAACYSARLVLPGIRYSSSLPDRQN